MLPTDNASAASKMAQSITDSRVRHFHDPRTPRLAGNVFGKGLLNEGGGPAWDIYIFYGKDVVWKDDPPKPVEWMHQLGGLRRANPKRFRTGEDLITQLHQAMHKLSGLECKSE